MRDRGSLGGQLGPQSGQMATTVCVIATGHSGLSSHSGHSICLAFIYIDV